ncbi:conjugal transfer protein TraH [Vibrio sinaloensis]|nr:conjugal transfer protein TraH [Vibrio sinaloensis]
MGYPLLGIRSIHPLLSRYKQLLGAIFDDTSYSVNVSNPTAYQGQSANYYTGGSLFVRNKIVDAQLVNVTVPSISAGCSGIDMFMGGLSHINSDQLVKLGKAIIHNAPPFVVNLALQTWAPQLKQNLDVLQSIADEYLNQSVNSCQATQAAIGGLAAFAAPRDQETCMRHTWHPDKHLLRLGSSTA